MIEGFIFIIVCEPERDQIPYAKNRKVLHTVRRWFAGVAAGCERERERSESDSGVPP